MEAKQYKKLIKRGIWAFLFALICLFVYKCSQPERMYLKFGKDKYGSYIVEVPYSIVKSQDCVAFKEWAKKEGSAFFAQDSCPWAKPIVSGPIGRFTVNGVKFNVPQKYLFFDNKYDRTSDGEHGTLFLGFIYPDI